jgi:membrane-associated protease RseP (regulator of RpoE activity)
MENQSTKYNALLLIVGLLFIIWGVLGLMDSKNYAYSGYDTDGNNTIIQVREGSPSEAAGLMVGDVMKSYDGIAVEDTKSFAKRARTEIGDVVEVVVDRDGEEQTLNITYSELPAKNASLNMAAFIMGLLFVLLGLLVHTKKKTALTLSFAVFSVFFGFVWFNGPNIEPGFLEQLVNSVSTTLVMFAVAAMAGFALKYPPKSAFLGGGSSKWLYAPAAVIVVIIWILNFAQPDSTSTLNTTMRMLFGVIILYYFGMALITLIRKYAKANAEERSANGLNLMLLGVILGILPFLINFIITRISPTTILPGSDYLFLTFAFIPIFFALALMKMKKAEPIES